MAVAQKLFDLRILIGPDLPDPVLEIGPKSRIAAIIAAEQFGGNRQGPDSHDPSHDGLEPCETPAIYRVESVT